jgi:hypothetical protein
MSGPEKDEITLVAPNGAGIEEKFRPRDTVAKTLDHAVDQFAKQKQLDPNVAYVLVLGATPLETSFTLEAAGVKVGDKLKVRSKTVPVDGDALGIVQDFVERYLNPTLMPHGCGWVRNAWRRSHAR